MLKEATQGHLPRRKIADTGRFLKTAIDNWLRTQDSCEILLSQTETLFDDENTDLFLDEIHKMRGRSEKEVSTK